MRGTNKEPAGVLPDGLQEDNAHCESGNSLSSTREQRLVRLLAWRQIRSALFDQSTALQQRIDANDALDIHLAADLRTFTELGEALCDL